MVPVQFIWCWLSLASDRLKPRETIQSHSQTLNSIINFGKQRYQWLTEGNALVNIHKGVAHNPKPHRPALWCTSATGMVGKKCQTPFQYAVIYNTGVSEPYIKYRGLHSFLQRSLFCIMKNPLISDKPMNCRHKIMIGLMLCSKQNTLSRTIRNTQNNRIGDNNYRILKAYSRGALIYLFVELRHILRPSITMCCALTNRTQRFRNRLGPAFPSHNLWCKSV